MESNIQTAFWLNVYNALVMHVKLTYLSLMSLVFASMFNPLFWLVGIFSIWDPPQFFAKVGLVSQGSAFHCSKFKWKTVNMFVGVTSIRKRKRMYLGFLGDDLYSRTRGLIWKSETYSNRNSVELQYIESLIISPVPIFHNFFPTFSNRW